VILRSDVIRKSLFGREPTDRLPPEAYVPEVSRRVFAIIDERAAACLGAGHAVIADAVYGTAQQRAEIEAEATRRGIPFLGIWLEAARATCVARVGERTGDASDADAGVVMRQTESIDAASVRWNRIRSDRPIAEVASDVLGLLTDYVRR
jgi:predicted kinase